MKRHRFCGMTLTLVLFCQPVLADILLSTTTDKAGYHSGEALDFHVTARNTADTPVTLNFGSSLQAQYELDGIYTAPTIGLTVLTSRTIPALSSYTWSYRHRWDDYVIPLGGHSAVGRVFGVGDTAPIAFEVVAPTLPTSSFSINFDDADAIEEYWQKGVHFRSQTSSSFPRPGIHDGHLKINSTTYPPGFNIIADFEMPVHGAEVDVSAAAGVSITMIAKDAAGNLLDTAVSAPVPALNAFLPLEVESTAGIASIEWWPSQNNSTVILDNLALELPEPAGFTLIASLMFLLRRRARRLEKEASC